MKRVRIIDFSAIVVLVIVLITMIMTGCVTPPAPPVTGLDMIRPDGSIVPDPDFSTNVNPWVYTNGLFVP